MRAMEESPSMPNHATAATRSLWQLRIQKYARNQIGLDTRLTLLDHDFRLYVISITFISLPSFSLPYISKVWVF